MRSFSFILCLLSAFLCSSCEGFKVLTLHNASGQTLRVQTYPALPEFRKTSMSEMAPLRPEGEYLVPADSSLTLLASFGPMLFNARIRERDLPMSRLRVIKGKDTLEADNRAAILRLTQQDPTRYRRKKDRLVVMDDNKNLEAIVIR